MWDLDLIDTWDGNVYGPDSWGFNIAGSPEPAWEYTFHSSGDPSLQSFPFAPAVSGINFAGGGWSDSIYQNLSFDFAHRNEDLTIGFYGRNLEGVGNEGWGLDNVRVYAATPADGRFIARFSIDKTSPAIANVSLSGTTNRPVSSMEVQFTESVRAGTFAAADIQLVGPSGAVAVEEPQRLNSASYRLSFPTQRADGAYQLIVGPDLEDLAGNRMAAPATNSFLIQRSPVSLTLAGPRVLGEDVCTNGQWFGAWEARPSDGQTAAYTYQWAFGDGATASGAVASHSYSALGIYLMAVAAYDHDYRVASATQQVVVAAGAPPVAAIAATGLNPEGTEPVTLNGISSADDHGIASYRWLLPLRRFDFPGQFVDPKQWTVANTVQDEQLTVTGLGDWSRSWFFSATTRMRRGGSMEGRVDTSTGTSYAMVGLRDANATAGSYDRFIYGLYFNDGVVQVYEKGSPQAVSIPYTKGASYDFRIEVKPDAGARYYLRASDTGLPFARIFETTNYTDTAFGFGANVVSGVFAFDDLTVDGAYVEGGSVTTPVFQDGTVWLEVVDHARQTNLTSVLVSAVTGLPPVAAIRGPARAQAGVELPFDAYGSSDDHAIATYTWDFDDDSPPRFGPAVSHRFDLPGVYTVTVTVTDYAAQQATASLIVTVEEGNALTCVPWRIISGIELPHETYSGKEIALKAVARNVSVPFDYIWDTGDGTPPITQTATNAADAYGLQTRHVYTASENTPFYATIRVVQTNGTVLSDTYPILVRAKSLDVEMNVAIDEGLWYLHKSQNRTDLDASTRSGNWSHASGHTINVTASAVQAFAINGHLLTDDGARDPYVETVQRGINYLLSKLTWTPIGPQTYGDPDGNGNGIAIYDSEGSPYQTGPVMDAFVAAASPDLVAQVGGPHVQGRTFRELMQDLVDVHSWGQSDGPIGGGWRYSWNSDLDNSACQWAAIGLIAAERYWDISAPAWVKQRNLQWLTNSCCFGYGGGGNGPATTPSGLIQLDYDGATILHPLWGIAETNVASAWGSAMVNTNIYAYYAIAKAFRLANPQPVEKLSATGLDWFRDPVNGLARKTVDRQLPDGSWVDGAYANVGPVGTAWSVIILTPSLFQRGPVAIIHSRPNPTAVGYPVVFDGRGSYHQHPAYRIVEYRWDFDASDGLDFEHPDGFGPVVTGYFGALGTNIVTLQVRDNATPAANGVESIEVHVTLPPHPPTADAAGPYVAAVNEDLHLDGSGSFDIDFADGDFIQAWDWEVDYQSPLDFDDGVSGEHAVMKGGFPTVGKHDLGLRVTDATSAVFPTSGKPDLTQADYTHVLVYNRVITNLTTRPKKTKCQLLWTKVGDYAVVLRSHLGPNHGFEEIGRTDSAFATFLDPYVEYNIGYFYRLFAYQNGKTDPLGVSDAVYAISHPLGTNDHAPYFVATPPRSATVGWLYETTLQARDPENDPFTFALLLGPTNLTVNPTNGLVRFTPAPDQLGTNLISFEVANAAGRDVLTYELVVFPVGNNPPVAAILTTLTPVTALTGQGISFWSTGSRDPDGDPLSYLWRFGDGDISTNVNPSHVYRAAGDYTVFLFVRDDRGGVGQASIDVHVSSANRAPIANAGPNQLAYVTKPVRLDGSASLDLEGDPLSFRWSFLTRPTGSTAVLADPTSSRPQFVPDEPGVYVIQLVVNDGQADSPADAVLVSTANSAPIANAGPDQRVGVGKVAQLDGSVSRDVDHDPLSYHWTLVSRPPGSTATLAGADTPRPSFTLDVEGGYQAQLVVNDGTVNSAPDTVLVTTRNFPPIITSVPFTNAIPRVLWHYEIIASDPYDANLTFALDEGPPGMTLGYQPPTLNPQLTWTPTVAQLGDHPVALRVTDSEGASAVQAFMANVGADVEPPHVTLRMVAGEVSNSGQWAIRLGESGTLQVSATDNADGPLASSALSLAVGAKAVALDTSGKGTVTASAAAGLYSVVATATDSVGNLGVATGTLLFYDPDATNSIWVQIHNPTNFESVPKAVPIVATITNLTDLVSYRVDFAPAGEVDLGNITVEGPQFTTLTNVTLPPGTRAITSATLATFDPTVLLNDDYVIRVVASDGRSLWYEPVVVSVNSNLKFGELHLEFTDLTVPVAGIPVTITRIYDSREAGRQGDFGQGWRLGLRDAAIRKTLRDVGVGPTMFPGSRVYINTPDGRRVGFTAQADSAVAFGFVFVWVGLHPDPGVYEKLEPVDNTAVYLQGVFLGALATEPYNPSEFRLTTKDDTVYSYHDREGLQKIEDLNGNTLVFATNGVTHSSGTRIEFLRDAKGRITRIIDPAGNALNYTYDAAGDLRSFADQVGNLTQYAYARKPAHYLTNIVDPLGRNAIQAEYDVQGRFVGIKDANGNASHQDFDAESNTVRFTDPNGHVQITQYDDNGNEIMKTVDGISTNYFAYDANNNEVWRKNARGFVTTRAYDNRGNLTQIVDALSNKTEIAYNELNRPLSVTDALGHTTQFRYDPQGQLTMVANTLGVQATFTRDAQGRVTSVTDFNGNTTTYDYTGGCSCGKPGKVINPDGSFRLYEYNAQGQTTREVNELGHDTVFFYDDASRLLWVSDAEGNTTRYTYAGNLKVSETDPLGRTTRYAYDAASRLIATTNAMGGVVRFEYDGNGNGTAVTDPVGNVTRFSYDAANRLTRQVNPWGHTNYYVYDAVGNRTEAVDRNGRRRTFEYDPLGRRTAERWWEGNAVVRTMQFRFNALGAMTNVSDPVGQLTFAFDALNRLERTTQRAVVGVPGFSLSYTYTAVGQVATVTDDWGVQVASEYDSRNELSRRIWRGGSLPGISMRFAYDAIGNQTNALRFADAGSTVLVGQSQQKYGALGTVSDIVHLSGAGVTQAQYHYERDAAQQIIKRTLNSQLATYQYDLIGQLTNVVYSVAQPNESYQYDLGGNRNGGGYLVTTNNQITADGTFTYGYDAEGNVVSRTHATTGSTTDYGYDHRNRLVSVVDKDSGGSVTATVEFTYDALNRRLEKRVNGVATGFLWNGENIWADVDARGGITTRYFLGNRLDLMLARYCADEGVRWYLTDNLGTVREVSDSTGVVVDRLTYDSFGVRLTGGVPGGGDRFGLGGREYDVESGFYYCRSRYYDPRVGRFLRPDPIGFAAGDVNLFRYAGNDPVRHVDPYGQTEMIEYLGTLLNKLNEVAMASIGTFHGFSAATFFFMGNILGVAGGSDADYAAALRQTARQVDDLQCQLSRANWYVERIGGPADLVGAYADGVEIVPGIRIGPDLEGALGSLAESSEAFAVLSDFLTLSCIDLPQTYYELFEGVGYGGFEMGAKIALVYFASVLGVEPPED